MKTFIPFIAIFWITYVEPGAELGCDTICPSQAEWLCATCDDGPSLANFSNKCSLTKYNQCTRLNGLGKCTLLHDGACHDVDYCDLQCPWNSTKICATDNNESTYFMSKCHLTAFNICYRKNFRKKVNGSCGLCDIVCPPLLKNPVCGKSETSCRTFPTRCLLDKHNACSIPKYRFTYVKDGICKIGEEGCNQTTYV